MKNVLDALSLAFCNECYARMQKIEAIVQNGVPLSRVQLDELHQEFDTLFGGARAIYLPELEYYFRSMARYARYLRNCLLAEGTIELDEWERLLKGISLGQNCKEGMMLLKEHNEERLLFIRKIEYLME